MPFVEVQAPIKAAQNRVVTRESDQAAIAIRAPMRKDKADHPRVLVLWFGGALIRKVGWAPDQRVRVWADIEAGAFRLQAVNQDSVVPSFQISLAGKKSGVAKLWVTGLLSNKLAERRAQVCKTEVLKQMGASQMVVIYGEPSWFATKALAARAL